MSYFLSQFLPLTAIILIASWLLAGAILFIQQVVEDFKEKE